MQMAIRQMMNRYAIAFMALATTNVVHGSSTTQPVPPPPFALGSVIGQATITIHHDLGARGEFWVTTEDTVTLPPPGSSPEVRETYANSRRIYRKFWLYKLGEDAPRKIFGSDFSIFKDNGSGFSDTGPIGSGTPVDILLDATLTTEGAIVTVAHLNDGTYEAGLWVNEKLGGWKFLGSDSEILIQGENSLPLRTATISGSLAKKDLTITLKGTKDTRRFRFRSDAGRWYELTSSTTRPAP